MEEEEQYFKPNLIHIQPGRNLEGEGEGEENRQANSPQLLIIKNYQSGGAMDYFDKFIKFPSEDHKGGEIFKDRNCLWIFLISPIHLLDRDLVRIKKVYNQCFENKNEITRPMFQHEKSINWFIATLTMHGQKHSFKIVTDIVHLQSVLSYHDNNAVNEIIIYVGENQDHNQALLTKADPRYPKANSVTSQFSDIILQFQTEMKYNENENDEGDDENRLKAEKFPNFMRLSGEDKTNALLYRLNLYAAKNIHPTDKFKRYKQFLEIILPNITTGSNRNKQLAKLKQFEDFYGKFEGEFDATLSAYDERDKFILECYVTGIFLYRIINTELRIMRLMEEFRPYSFPFYELYHSIKRFHKKNMLMSNSIFRVGQSTRRQEEKKNNPQLFHEFHENENVVFRGAKFFSKRSIAYLQKEQSIGEFIEMFGFLSCSKSLTSALSFCDETYTIIVIHVPKRKIEGVDFERDHGFVDLQIAKVNPEGYEGEEQVLFNALNVYQILKTQKRDIKIKDSQNDLVKFPCTLIHLEYGAIFKLMDLDQFSKKQYDVLLNYEYCSEMQSKIEDEGDVHLFLNEFNDAINYYEEKISEDQSSFKNYHKISIVQHRKGELNRASQNNEKALRILEQKKEGEQEEKSKEVFYVNAHHSEIEFSRSNFKKMQQHILNAKRAKNKIPPEENNFQSSEQMEIELLQKEGKMHFSLGKLSKAEECYEKCEEIIKKIENKIKSEENQIRKESLWKRFKNCIGCVLCLCCFCCCQNPKQRCSKYDKIREEEQQSLSKVTKRFNNEWRIKVKKIKTSMISSWSQVKQKVGNRQRYAQYVKNHFNVILKEYAEVSDEPEERARWEVLSMTMKDYCDLVKSENILLESLRSLNIVQGTDPYSQTLGELKEQVAQKLKKILQDEQNRSPAEKCSSVPEKYNEQKRKTILKKCLENYERAKVIARKNNKSEDFEEAIKIDRELIDTHYKFGKFSDSLSLINDLLGINKTNMDIVRCIIIRAKIYYQRGIIDKSMSELSQAEKLLQEILVRDEKDDEKVMQHYRQSEEYIEIFMLKAKIYLNKKEKAKCENEIKKLKQGLRSDPESWEDKKVVAFYYELQGLLDLQKNLPGSFQFHADKGIEILERTLGKYHYQNALMKCKYVISLVQINNYPKAYSVMADAEKTFMRLFTKNPSIWPLLFSKSILLMKSDLKQAINLLESCKVKAKERLDPSHISLKKISYQINMLKMKHSDLEIRKTLRSRIIMGSESQSDIIRDSIIRRENPNLHISRGELKRLLEKSREIEDETQFLEVKLFFQANYLELLDKGEVMIFNQR